MESRDDIHLDVLIEIEQSLMSEYERNADLNDTICVFGLENAVVAIKKKYGYAKNESVSDMPSVQGIVNSCVQIGMARIDNVNNLTLKEYVKRIDKVKKSVIRHSKSGSRGYYEFIKRFF